MRKFMNEKTGEAVSFLYWSELEISEYLSKKGGDWKEVFTND